ncbi:hypothetical protein MKW98_013937, partial [Papaver atlanticum]
GVCQLLIKLKFFENKYPNHLLLLRLNPPQWFLKCWESSIYLVNVHKHEICDGQLSFRGNGYLRCENSISCTVEVIYLYVDYYNPIVTTDFRGSLLALRELQRSNYRLP